MVSCEVAPHHTSQITPHTSPFFLWACRLEDSPSGFPLQVLAEDGSGFSCPIPNAHAELPYHQER